jgi:carboxylesterase
MKSVLIHLGLFFSILLSACSSDPDITPGVLGDGILLDPSLYEPAKYLVSLAVPAPTPEQALKPVIIACHGYTATTFEWDELRNWSAGSDVYLSQVLLGGHGRSYEEFKESSWHDWQRAIKEEYERLEKAGYQNINLLGC